MKKTIAFLLAVLMLLPALAACGKEELPEQTEDSAVTTEATEPAETEEKPDLPDPGSLNIGGDFHFLVAGNWAWNDYTSEGEEGNVIDIAIYRRNAYMQETYGVEVTNEDIVRYSSSMGTGDGFVKIYRDYMAGDHTYDAAMIGTYDVATLAYSGYIHDLNSVPHLDLTKSYWDQKANADLSINGKMYYTTGDISVADNRATYVLLFNKDMMADYNLGDPYALVRENKWDLETFGKMVKAVANDNNNDGIYDKNDTFGLMTPTDTYLAILSAAGEKIATVNDEGQLELTFYSERVVNLYEKFMEIAGDHSCSYNYQFNYMTGATGLTSTNEERIAMFGAKQGLFYSHTMFYLDYLRDLDIDFGILPYPKYDAAQENYYNLVSAWHSQFLCVPEGVADFERTGIVLEALAYQGKKLLTPAYYEKTLVGQYTRDEESAEMLDLIFSNLVYDMGIYYNIGTYKDQLTAMARTGKTVTNIAETYRNTAQSKIDKLNKFFAEGAAQ